MKSATVIGCGIVGLTSAIKLQEKGYHVKIVSKEQFNSTLSSKVGAIWFPFEIYPKEKTNHWAKLAYKEYQLETQLNNGVSFIHFITAYNEDSNTDWTLEMPEGTTRKAIKSELPKGMENGFISIVPLAEPYLYLPYLFKKFISKGGKFMNKEIFYLKEASTLDDLVINCTGLGAKKLCNDEDLQPLRGQILRCEKVNIASYANTTKQGALSYIINRSKDCIIGGTDYVNDWNMDVEKSDTKLIIQRFLETGLTDQQPKIIEEIVGLRPKRSAVRFEFDSEFNNVFHNYGHGGSGFTVAWGCAIELAEILNASQV